MNGAGGSMRLMRPHYVDPQTNIVYDTNAADFEGWLTKQSSWLKVRSTPFENSLVLVWWLTFFVRVPVVGIQYLLSLPLLVCDWDLAPPTNSYYHCSLLFPSLVNTHTLLHTTHLHTTNCGSSLVVFLGLASPLFHSQGFEIILRQDRLQCTPRDD